MPEANMKYVEITVCSPNKDLLATGADEYDLDSEDATSTSAARQDGVPGSQDWKNFDRGRLSIQVTYNYRMIIPFADMMLYLIYTGQEAADLLWTFKLGKQHPQVQQQQTNAQKYNQLASKGMYVMPIRANYLMRMQSNLFPDATGHELPQSNECQIRFPKKGEEAGGGGSVPDNLDDNSNPPPDPP
jgi:hypothetical protein